MSTRFDWPGLMRAGMRGLGLRPEEFWALSPAELMFLLGTGTAPMGRERLQELARAFPDSKEHEVKDGGAGEL